MIGTDGSVAQPPGGIDEFIADVERTVVQTLSAQASARRFMLVIGERYAAIRPRDIWRPARFLSQMAGAPPKSFGTHGFREDLVDDANPARHYIAFVFVGFWLPRLLAIGVLWGWEVAGFIRYGGHWSKNDVRNGYVGIRHGALVRRYGPTILPSLIASDVAHTSPNRPA